MFRLRCGYLQRGWRCELLAMRARKVQHHECDLLFELFSRAVRGILCELNVHGMRDREGGSGGGIVVVQSVSERAVPECLWGT